MTSRRYLSAALPLVLVVTTVGCGLSRLLKSDDDKAPPNPDSEPIIIENGPVRIHFNPLLHSNFSGGTDSQYTFSRQPSGPITGARLWLGQDVVKCPEEKCADPGRNVWSASGDIVLTLKHPQGAVKTIVFQQQPQKRLAVKSELGVQWRGLNGVGNRRRASIELVNSAADYSIFSVKLASDTTVYPRGSTPSPADYAVPLRIHLCVNTTNAESYCPDLADWP